MIGWAATRTIASQRRGSSENSIIPGRSATAAAPGPKPFATSSTNAAMPYGHPHTRPQLVAPMFFEPCSRMSTPRALPMSHPNGIEPTR
jgi:hypothetical protein